MGRNGGPVTGSAGGSRAVGEYGERLAAAHLEEAGMQILDRNWRCDQGEIDIVAADGDCLVVCEVKTRRSQRFGLPIEAVTPAKAARLRRLAGAWVEANPSVARRRGLRIDVVGVLCAPRSATVVDHRVGVA